MYLQIDSAYCCLKNLTLTTREAVATEDVTKTSPTSAICLPMTEDSSNSSLILIVNWQYTRLSITPMLDSD